MISNENFEFVAPVNLTSFAKVASGCQCQGLFGGGRKFLFVPTGEGRPRNDREPLNIDVSGVATRTAGQLKLNSENKTGRIRAIAGMAFAVCLRVHFDFGNSQNLRVRVAAAYSARGICFLLNFFIFSGARYGRLDQVERGGGPRPRCPGRSFRVPTRATRDNCSRI